jgi:quercetin dioxygenase-like cupin family protein
MRHVTVRTATTTAALLAVTVVCAAQQPSFKRTELQRADLSVAGREVIQAIADIPAGATSGRHTHPGEEIGYVLDGSVLVEVDGKPAATLKTGQYFIIPAGTIHNATNKSGGAARVLATYVVEKGKPLATPAK